MQELHRTRIPGPDTSDVTDRKTTHAGVVVGVE